MQCASVSIMHSATAACQANDRSGPTYTPISSFVFAPWMFTGGRLQPRSSVHLLINGSVWPQYTVDIVCLFGGQNGKTWLNPSLHGLLKYPSYSVLRGISSHRVRFRSNVCTCIYVISPLISCVHDNGQLKIFRTTSHRDIFNIVRNIYSFTYLLTYPGIYTTVA